MYLIAIFIKFNNLWETSAPTIPNIISTSNISILKLHNLAKYFAISFQSPLLTSHSRNRCNIVSVKLWQNVQLLFSIIPHWYNFSFVISVECNILYWNSLSFVAVVQEYIAAKYSRNLSWEIVILKIVFHFWYVLSGKESVLDTNESYINFTTLFEHVIIRFSFKWCSVSLRVLATHRFSLYFTGIAWIRL